MASDVSITFASNRGPVSFIEEDGSFDTKRGAGGLAGALDPVARRLGQDALWIAAGTSDTDRSAIAAGATAGLLDELGYRVELLDIEPNTYAEYYDDISNRLLWFANHCLWAEVGIEPGPEALEGWRDAYVPVNEHFARRITELGHDDALVFFQDYHLSVAPAALRRLRPEVKSLHFTHSSFCGFDSGIGHLPSPMPAEIIEGMLGADLIGFHEPRWAHNFLDCCERLDHPVDHDRGVVRIDDRQAWVRCYPIPIDSNDLRARAGLDEARGWAARHLEWAAGRSLIVRADRMEPSKNIVRGFEAYGRLLDDDSTLADKTCFIACVYPSRQDVPEYQEYARQIHAVVDEVNGRHPDSIALFDEDDFDRSLGALLDYDVLLVNSLMDGMNLVSKEGPTLNERDGILVLSKGAGSFDEMRSGSVVIEDPYDVQETAARLKEALELAPAERRTRAEQVRSAARARMPEDWLDEQLEDLVSIRDGNEPLRSLQQLPQ